MADKQSKITIEMDIQCDHVPFDRKKLEDMLRGVCRTFCCPQATISTAILDDKAIRKLNSRFLGSATATDVISFDTSGGDQKHFDLAVNAQKAAREAQDRGHKAEAELALYVLHGLLHNLGFDDTNARQAEKMHKTEDDILQKAGYGVVYKP